MAKAVWSAPPVIENVIVSGGKSSSVAVTVSRSKASSGMLMFAAEVKTGASLVSVTVTVIRRHRRRKAVTAG